MLNALLWRLWYWLSVAWTVGCTWLYITSPPFVSAEEHVTRKAMTSVAMGIPWALGGLGQCLQRMVTGRWP